MQLGGAQLACAHLRLNSGNVQSVALTVAEWRLMMVPVIWLAHGMGNWFRHVVGRGGTRTSRGASVDGFYGDEALLEGDFVVAKGRKRRGIDVFAVRQNGAMLAQAGCVNVAHAISSCLVGQLADGSAVW